MAAEGTSSTNSAKVSLGFTAALASALQEWLLIFMLFIDAVYSYVVTKFARYCRLQVPCPFCSRLDHVLGSEKLGFYWDLICGNHKSEISSLVLCHEHNKLADVHGMCENCLFSFATINKSNAETYRLLVAKLGEVSPIGFDRDPLLEGCKSDSSSTRRCSCCNELWIPRRYAEELLHTRSVGSEAADVPLSGVGHGQGDLKERRDGSMGSVRAAKLGARFDPLSHVGYMEVNSSDTESEVLISEDDDASELVPETNNLKEDLTVHWVQTEPRNSTHDFASEKLIEPASEAEPSFLVSRMQLHSVKPQVGTSVASTVAIGHGLEELNWQQAEHKPDPSPPIEFISFDVVPSSSNLVETPSQASKASLEVKEVGDVIQTSLSESGKISKVGSRPTITNEISVEMKNDMNHQMPSNFDLGDAYRIAVGNRGRELSGKFAEQRSLKDSARLSEDLKLLLSQISSTRGIELSLNDMSPGVSGNSDEVKTIDASSSVGIQILQKRISLERNESGLESLDGSIVSEIEGENVSDRLKRQVEHDRKLLSALYKELEEERNASAVAANQAMAMITRLQEEKAALHMEALQYLRMMEEQSEYDMEALQKSNDLLAEREKEIQDLEAEVEFYRNKFPNESVLEIPDPTSDSKVRDVMVEQSEASCVEDSARNLVTEKPVIYQKIEESDISLEDKSEFKLNNTLFEFEDERSYISQCLKKLEQSLNLSSNTGVSPDLANGEIFGKEGHEISDLNKQKYEGLSRERDETEDNVLCVQNDVSVSEGSLHSHVQDTSCENSHFVNEEKNECKSVRQGSPMVFRETNLTAPGKVISELNYRLEALEADRDFLEHVINSLRNGDEGLLFIKEIASHLRELRRIGIRREGQPVV